MRIRDYKKKKLKNYNRIINIFLALLISFSILALISIGMSQAAIKHFEKRSEAISENAANLLAENSKEFLKNDLLNFQDQLENVIAKDSSKPDLCDMDLSNIEDETLKKQVEEMCGKGSLRISDLPKDIIEESGTELIDSQIDSIKVDLKAKIKAQLDEEISAKQEKLQNLQDKYPILKLTTLNIIIAILAFLYLINNGLVIAIHYLSKKLMIIIPLIFILPYLLFKFKLLQASFEKITPNNLLNSSELPINTSLLMQKLLDLVSNEMTLYYKGFLTEALIGFFAGLILYFGNKYLIMPYFAAKHKNEWEMNKND